MNDKGQKDTQALLRSSLLKIKELKAQLREQESSKGEPIAVIGVGCRFPAGARGPDDFFRALEEGVDAVRKIPEERWTAEALAGGRPEVQWAALLDAVDVFDAAFFGISPREAMRLDPQQRLLLEVAWEALESAGARADRLLGSRTGVFVGMCSADYQQHVREAEPFDAYSATGTMFSTAAGRLSYVFGLQGPCMTIDTACSSSLVAAHLACQSLRRGESDLALAGGVSLILDATAMRMLEKTQALSPDGRCKAFDAGANGFVRGEGCGVVVLKRLSDAERDGDPILAVIRGSAVNQDGRSSGLTAPNVLSQQAMLQSALEDARLSAEDIDYIETHGTGTSLGDPIEFEALRAVLGKPRADGSRCVLGAVKTNMGHLEAAAGVAGLIKAVLCLQHEAIPRNLHFEALNPRIDLEGTPFVIPTETVPWKPRGKPRHAGVSSFGLSGTNAHVILEEAPRRSEAAAKPQEVSCFLLPLSAKSPEALVALARSHREALSTSEAHLHDITFTASARRVHHEHRLAVTGRSKQEIGEALEAFVRGEAPAGLVQGEAEASAPRVVFIFPGQGSQWAGMGRALLAEEPAFREALTAWDARLLPHTGFSLLDELARPEQSSRLGETVVAQPALFAIGVALAALLASWGIRPDAVLGHSVGEIAAAHVAGVLDAEEAARLCALRGRIMQKATGHGKMVSVALGEAEARHAISGHEDRIGIAAVNDPGQVVLAGEVDALDALVSHLSARGVQCRELRVDYAFHSPQMEPLRREFVEALGRVAPKRATIPMYSTVTGDKVSGEELDAAYWGSNLRQTVRFERAVGRALEEGYRLFVEVGPHPVLSLNVEQCLAARGEEGHAVATLRRRKEERQSMLGALGALYARGRAVDWERLFPRGGQVVRLPSHPWQRKRYWATGAGKTRITPSLPDAANAYALSGATLRLPGEVLYQVLPLGLSHQPYLIDHQVHGRVVVPGAFHLAVVLAVAADRFGAAEATLREVQFLRPVVLEGDTELHIALRPRPEGGYDFTVSTPEAGAAAGDTKFRDHVRGTLLLGVGPRAAAPSLVSLRSQLETPMSLDWLHRQLSSSQIEWGPGWQWIREVHAERDTGLARISPAPGASPAEGPLHPILLDNTFVAGVVGLLAAHADGAGDDAPYLPWALKELRCYAPVTGVVHCHGQMQPRSSLKEETIGCHIRLLSENGESLVEIDEFSLKRAPRSALFREEADAHLFELAWRVEPGALAPSAPASGSRWLVLSDTEARGAALGARWATAGAAWTLGILGEVFADPTDRSRLVELLSRASASAPLTGVVCWWSDAAIGAGEGDAAARAEQRTLMGLYVAQALLEVAARSPGASPPRLWWVTEGAQAFEAGAPVAITQAPLWGLGRVLMLEHPELACTLIDVESTAKDAVDAVWQEICRADDEAQIAWRSGGRRVARLIKAPLHHGDEARLSAAAAGTVLVTGGLGALGLHVARWLWEKHRVRHLVLAGRRAPEGSRLAEIERLRAEGAAITVAQADVANAAELRALLSALPAERPLCGVIHAAGVLDDGVLTEQDAARLSTVFAPKAHGALLLHEMTRDLPLAFFVLFSSAASLLGNAGQGNYAAANAFLDALAHRRRAEGLPALSLNWGPWSEGGMAEAISGALRARSARVGMGALTPELGVSLLGQALSRPEAELAVLPLDLRALQEALGREVPPLWRALCATRPEGARAMGSGAFLERLSALDPSARAAEVESAVRADVARVMSLPVHEVPEGRPLRELGLDSLMAVELRNALSARMGKPLPATLVFDYPTVSALSRHLLEKVQLVEQPRVAALVPAPRPAPREEAIAILGIGCRFPGGARDPESFFRLLEGEVDAIREVPRERWDIDAYYDPNPDAPGKMTSRWGGFLDGVDLFEPAFFGISPREAVSLDPQQRLLLETTWEALERAGLTAERLLGSDTGVYIGICGSEYQSLTMSSVDVIDAYSGLGTVPSAIVGRISYWLGIKGPNMAVDTACSSSLVAVHLACQALRTGECSLALAGGVSLILAPEGTVYFSRVRAMSPTGRCHAFSADADGYVRSDGCGVLVLKRLSDAERDGDPILAVIRGSAVNQDGRSQGLTAPNGPSQEAVIRQALSQAGLSPAAVGYVEAHGTGTPLGDPIEVQALGAVLGEGRSKDNPVLIGSVKTNIGHTEGAAGAAGLIKAVLALQHGIIPRSLHFEAPNPHIPWSELPVKVAAETTPWPSKGSPRVAGVSSFGFSGTNAHIILEEAPHRREAEEPKEISSYLLPLSAKSPEALVALARAHQRVLVEGEARLHDIAFTASARRSHHEQRLAAIGGSKEEIGAMLEAFTRGEATAGLVQGKAPPGRPRVAFVFPGQGSQWLGMGRSLLAEEPAFREAIEACDEAIHRESGYSVIEELLADEAHSRLGEIDVVQPVLFAVEVALAAVWRSWGVEPDTVVGHSMGEVAAAYVAGALTLEDAAKIICRRSRLLKRVSGQGAMGLVELTLEQAKEALSGYEDRLSVAVSNGPRATVLAGDPAALEEVLVKLEGKGVFCRRVKVDVASHSPQMDPLRGELLTALGRITPRATQLAMRSTVTGEPLRGEELSTGYWADNLRQPVLFSQATQKLIDEGHTLFLEMSPHPILLPSVEENLREKGRGGAAIASLRRQSDERRCLWEALGALYVHGHVVDWQRLYPEGGRVARLPTYPWQRERYWVEPVAKAPAASALGRALAQRASGHPLLGASFSSSAHPEEHLWEQPLRVEAIAYLADHRVQGEVVVPAAAYVEMALAAGAEIFGGAELSIAQMSIEQMLALPSKGERVVQTVLTEEGSGRASFQIASRGEGETSWQKHASGKLHRLGGEAQPACDRESPHVWRGKVESPLPPAEHYQRMEERGLTYGPAFQGVVELWAGEGEALGRVRLPEAIDDTGYALHPALLDACLQVSAGIFGSSKDDGTYVPVGIERVHVHRRPGREIWVSVAMRAERSEDERERLFDLRLLDEGRKELGTIEGLRVRRLLSRPTATRDELDECVYEVEWRRVEALPEVPLPQKGAWLVFTDRGGVGSSLLHLLSAEGQRCVRVFSGAPYARLEPELFSIDPSKPEDYRRLLDEAFAPEERCLGAVHLFSLDATPLSATTPESLDEDLLRGSISAAYLAQALVRQGWRDVPRLFLISRGAQSVGASQAPVSVAQAPLWGLGKTIALEHPELKCTRIDLDPSLNDEESKLLWRELVCRDREDQIALRGESRYAARLVRSRFQIEGGAEAKRRLEPAAGRPFRLDIEKPGVLERLALREVQRRPPGPGEVEIEIEAAGLNFIDVMKAMGIYPGLQPGPVPLGGECAGRIVALGEGVTDLAIGEEVIALAPSAFASHATTAARFVVPKPAHLRFEQAATIATVFMTVWYAFIHLGRARRGERVLIHAATGGTGLAAVQVARTLGLEIFATAGSEEKRAYLRAMGIEHVMDSRSLAFADEIMKVTKGRGVDLVLNSLTGEALVKSLEVLAPYGRFLEMGKRDIYDNARLGLLPFKKSLSYSSIDLVGMSVERPELFASLLREVTQRFEEGAFEPLPVKVFSASEAEEAFRFMAQAKHIGKIAISMKDPGARLVPAAEDCAVKIRADGSYLITGGLGGLGLRLAQWLVEKGARQLALVGRRGPDEGAQSAIVSMEKAGARVLVLSADVSQSSDVERVLSAIASELAPLGGVVHAAGVLDDHTLLELSKESFQRVFAPKARGAWNLHTATKDMDLDFFVMYSSSSSLFGSPGQGNYAAANSFLDALARERAGARLPAMSVQWGAFAEVGLAAAQKNRGERLSHRGAASFTPDEGLAALARLFEHPRAEVGVARVDLRQWVEFYPGAAGLPFFAELPREGAAARQGGAEGSRALEALKAAEPAGRQALLEKHLLGQVGSVLRLDSARIDRHAPFTKLGMDSLMSLELRNRLEASLGLQLSATLLFTYATPAALTEHLLERLDLPGQAKTEPPPPPDEGAPPPLDDAELLAFFDATLEHAEKVR
uniref:Short-chain dehydrogenase/reductase SDR n=1 Tax=Racemicystis crocea TaxID=1707966 RepID=A0A3S5GYN7_9BACT|nr:short-chain dehydrogenase/reductase SDR [Racemicystis crocea]